MTEIALALALAGAVSAPERLGPSPKPPPVPREFRGVWVATVSNIDWPSSRTLTPAQQRQQAIAILDRAVELRLNAIVLQVRPACDALYSSAIEPWSEYLTNVMGTAPSPLYDPLHFWVAEAHARGLELHAWFNPFRALASSHRNAIASNHVSITKPHLVKDYGDAKWLDPGFHESREHSLNVILDVLNRYDVDGIHFDDYFYPYPDGTRTFPDDATYDAYLDAGGALTRGDWRRENVNALVREVSEAIASTRADVRFGISPFGIHRPGMPPGIVGLDAYATLYCDAPRWIAEGWVDYLAPQLYWPSTQTAQAFGPLIEWWAMRPREEGRSIFAGLNLTRLGETEAWTVDEIRAQVELTRGQRALGARGVILYTVEPLLDDRLGVRALFADELFAAPAASPPLASAAGASLPPPRVSVEGTTVTPSGPGGARVRAYAVYARAAGAWTLERLVQGAVELEPGRAYAVSAIDARGVESGGVLVELP